MYYETFLTKILAQFSCKINQIAISRLDAIFAICFVMAVTTIVTGIAINLHYHNLFN